ncbi:MAG TPA: hypothetical protein VGJ48_12165 [Pyrinomonadaceae bacterium]
MKHRKVSNLHGWLPRFLITVLSKSHGADIAGIYIETSYRFEVSRTVVQPVRTIAEHSADLAQIGPDISRVVFGNFDGPVEILRRTSSSASALTVRQDNHNSKNQQ